MNPELPTTSRRRRRRRRRLILPAVVLIGSAGVALAAVNLAGDAAHGSKASVKVQSPAKSDEQTVLVSSKPKDDGSTPKSFLISGNVGGLSPGVAGSLYLRITNPNNSDISVRSLGVQVARASANCPASAVRVGGFTGPVFVPGRGTAQIVLPITLAASAPDSCQAARWPLAYDGRAVKA